MTTKAKLLALEKKIQHEITLDLPWSRTKRLYEVFPPKIGCGQFKTRPEPWAKITAAYFSRKEIVRLYRRSGLI